MCPLRRLYFRVEIDDPQCVTFITDNENADPTAETPRTVIELPQRIIIRTLSVLPPEMKSNILTLDPSLV
jgi:hypothetical protein